MDETFAPTFIATYSLLGICFPLLIGSLSVVMLVGIPFTIRRIPLWIRLWMISAGLLGSYGAVGFFAAQLSASGGFNSLSPTTEWPVGYSSDIKTTASGFHLVPLNGAARVQVYDSNWKFVRAWVVGTSGVNFKVDISDADQVDVISPRGSSRYDLSGQYIERRSSTRYDAVTPGTSHLFKTPIWLWVFANQFVAFSAYTIGSGLWALAGLKETSRQEKDQSAMIERRKRLLRFS